MGGGVEGNRGELKERRRWAQSHVCLRNLLSERIIAFFNLESIIKGLTSELGA